MQAHDIDDFFQRLSRLLDFPLRCVLLGGAEAVLLGNARPTYGIDFQTVVKASTPEEHERKWKVLEQAIETVVRQTGIKAQYAEDVDRWGLIVLIPKPPRPYKKFGKITVAFMDPLVWAIGKLSRFHTPDVQDLISVFHKQKPKFKEAALVWGKALGSSPRSPAQALFKRNTLHFMRTYGPKIWKSFHAAEWEIAFMKAAQSSFKKRSQTL